MASRIELGLHRATAEALIKLDRQDPRRQEIERLASAATLNGTSTLEVKATHETPNEISRFTKEDKKFLKKEGISVIYALNGQTIHGQEHAGRPFWFIASSEGGSLLDVHAKYSEVAIDTNPNKFFLPKSNNATLSQQLEMIAEHSYKLQRRLGATTIEAIMGEAPDYTQLAFGNLDATGERLFGEKYNYNYARTKTPTVGTRVAFVGYFDATDGLLVDDWDRGDGRSCVFASPLVVPKA